MEATHTGGTTRHRTIGVRESGNDTQRAGTRPQTTVCRVGFNNFPDAYGRDANPAPEGNVRTPRQAAMHPDVAACRGTTTVNKGKAGTVKITTTQLEEAGACEEEVNEFRDRFGEEVDVTEELCIQNANAFSWSWAGTYLLTEDAYRVYSTAVDEAQQLHDATTKDTYDAWLAVSDEAGKVMQATIQPALDAYYDAVNRRGSYASERNAYNRVYAQARKAYHEATTATYDAYDVVRNEANRVFRKTQAAAWGRAYNSMEKDNG